MEYCRPRSPKEHLGDELLRRLAGRWVTGSAFQHGQGKWYQVRNWRWAHHCFWRKDGELLWLIRNIRRS